MFRRLSILALSAALFAGGTALAGEGGDRTAVFHVEGMTCGLCAKSIDKALRSVDGVRSVEIDRDAERVAVVADTSLGMDRLEATIESAGRYEAELLDGRSPQPASQ